MGACAIEEHIKLPSSKGRDVLCALGKKEASAYVKAIREAEIMIGKEYRVYGSHEKETSKWALKNPETGKRPYA
jgi:sialic acid synthase SpsE